MPQSGLFCLRGCCGGWKTSVFRILSAFSTQCRTVDLEDEKVFSKYIVFPFETCCPVRREKHVGETSCLLQQFASTATLQTPLAAAMG